MHVALMWIGFANFITKMQETTPINDNYYVRARKLMQVMSKKYIYGEEVVKLTEKMNANRF